MSAECFVKNKMLHECQEFIFTVIINMIIAAQLGWQLQVRWFSI